MFGSFLRPLAWLTSDVSAFMGGFVALFHTTLHHLQHLPLPIPTAIMPRARNRHARSAPVADVEERRDMVHIKTKSECRLANETVDVWVVELPSRYAESILKATKEHIPGQETVDLQHLRRFARTKFVPAHVVGQRNYIKEMHSVPRTWDDATPQSVTQNPVTNSWDWASPTKKRDSDKKGEKTLYLIVCPAHLITAKDLADFLIKYQPFTSDADSWAYPLDIKKAPVPRMPPTKPEQAEEWSAVYWPTFYRKTNPFGAHPNQILNAEGDLKHPLIGNISVEAAFELAEKAGEQTVAQGHSAFATGCVIVERVEGKTQIIAAAGDARYKPMPNAADVADEASKDHACCYKGNPMCHAAMRAIGMVGRKRLRCTTPKVDKQVHKGEDALAANGLARDEKSRDAFFLDLPLNELEEQYFKRDNIVPDGYLCLGLEIFLTHEPCVMCSMALVHSRVGRVVFKHRMPKTGGLTSELVSNDTGPVGRGYGLCWRKELNWQFMCWEYTPVDEAGKPTHSTYPQDDEPTEPVTVKPEEGHPAVVSRQRKNKNKNRSTTDGARDVQAMPDPYVHSFARVHV